MRRHGLGQAVSHCEDQIYELCWVRGFGGEVNAYLWDHRAERRGGVCEDKNGETKGHRWDRGGKRVLDVSGKENVRIIKDAEIDIRKC